MKSNVLLVAVCLGVIGGHSACGDSPSAPQDHTATASFSLKLSATAAELIARVEVVIAGPDMAEIRQELRREGDIYTGILEVLAGSDRSFTLNGYDASRYLIYTGTEYADVIVDQRIRVEITMRRVPIAAGSIEIAGLFDFAVGSIEITGIFNP